MRRLPVYLSLLSLVALPVLAQDATSEPTADLTPDVSMEQPTAEATAAVLPDSITIASPGLMPEGIEWNAETGEFYISSLSQGTIHAVADDGTLTERFSSEAMTSSAGLELDEDNGRLLVAAQTADGGGALFAFDVETGEQLAQVDFGPILPDADSFFPNDLAVDDDGNVYVTDSQNSLIYKVTPDYVGEVWAQDPRFVGNFTINGIAHAEGSDYLIAVQGDGLMKLPLADPTAWTTVDLDVRLRGDGIVFLDSQTLVVIFNSGSTAFRFESEDDFESATNTGLAVMRFESPTTAAVRDGEIFVVYARFRTPGAEEYWIDRAEFGEVVE